MWEKGQDRGKVAPTMIGRGPATNGKDVELPIFYLDCEVEVQITMGFVYERISFLNTTGEYVDGVFMAPTNRGMATVCSCDITFAGKTFSTSVVDLKGDLKENEELKGKGKGESGPGGDFQYEPACFSMPFAKLPKMSEIIVEIRYVQDLSFDHMKGEYSLLVPMYFPKGKDQIYEKKSFSEVINYRVLLAPGTEDGNWECPTHQLNVTNVSPGPNNVGKIITLEGNGQNQNSDFIISYSAWANRVTGSVLCEEDGRGGGSFMAFLQPPSFAIAKPLARKMVFLIDVSYSMTGKVLDHAKTALLAAMDDLQEHDFFALCAYDDKMRWYHTDMEPASANAVASGKTWVKSLETTGLTDILQPIRAGTKLLQKASEVAHGGSGGGFGNHGSAGGFTKASANPMKSEQTATAGTGKEIPFLVLITDGAVYRSQENDIISFARDASLGRDKQVRISTFGIGPYCNRYFLSNLSEAGMGYSETCLDPEGIQERMVNFLSKTKSPVLADISLGANNLYLYPAKIPDLTVGAPLVIYGSYDNQFPSVLSVSGTTADGPTTFDISSSIAENAPVVKMVEKRRIESMIGEWYLKDKNEAGRKEIVDKSVAIGVPCVLTRTAAYENPDAVAVHKHPNHSVPRGWATGATDNTLPPKTSVHHRIHQRKNRPMAAAAAVGGVVIVGTGVAAAMAFGNVGATGANIAVVDGMTSFFSEGFNGLNMISGGGFGDVFGAIGGGLGDAGNFLGDAIPDAAGQVGGACSELCGPGGSIAQCFDGAGSFCGCGPICDGNVGAFFTDTCGGLGQIFDPCADIGVQCFDAVASCDFGQVFEHCGSCGGAICEGGSNCASAIGPCLGGVMEGAGSCASAIGPCLGSVAECAGSCAGAIGPCLGGLLEATGGICECLASIAGALG